MYSGQFRLVCVPKVSTTPEYFLGSIKLFCRAVRLRIDLGLGSRSAIFMLDLCMLASCRLTCSQVWLGLGWSEVSGFRQSGILSLFGLDQLLPTLNFIQLFCR
jgi:hypothetical protein